jgi:PUA-domain protein
MRRTRVKAKEIARLLEKYDINLSKKDSVEIVEEDFKVIMINGLASFFYVDDKVFPTLKYLQREIVLKKIVVDMGAIKFVVNGADIMRPGIVDIEIGIKKDDYIVVIDEDNQKPLCVGIALLDSEEMQASTTGKSVKNVHYVGDDLWNDY